MTEERDRKKIYTTAAASIILAALMCAACSWHMRFAAGKAQNVAGAAEVSAENPSGLTSGQGEKLPEDVARRRILPERSIPTTAAGGIAECLTADGPFDNTHETLSVPTQFTKTGEDYFILDCYHDRLLTAESPDIPLSEWKVVTDRLSHPHTIAGNGRIYLVDNTDANQLLVFEKKDGSFVHTATFEDTGVRPHYIVYDDKEEAFYAWSSQTGEMYVIRDDGKEAYIEDIRSIPELDGVYVRSFTLEGGFVYFVSGNGSIIKADRENFEIKERYPVPDSIAGMVQLTHIQDYFYITVSTDAAGNQEAATLIRVKDPGELESGSFEDIYGLFTDLEGTPYYITQSDGRWYMCNHRTAPGVFSFVVEDNLITDIREMF